MYLTQHRLIRADLTIKYLYIKFTLRRIISHGFIHIIKSIIEQILIVIVATLLLPLSIIFYFLNIRITNIFIERIGHLAVEPACILNEYKCKYKIIIPIKGNIANNYLLKIWSLKYFVVNSRMISWVLTSMTFFKISFLNCAKYERVFDRPRLSYKTFSDKLHIDFIDTSLSKDILYLRNYLNMLGLNSNDWYVCVHAREEGFSLVDDYIQKHRNANIDNYKKSIEYILSLGGWVIRLGDKSMKKINSTHDRLIDYPHSNYKNEMLDVLLCKQARFILGSTSGICSVASLLGTPCAIANLLPTGDAWYTAKDIYMTKKIYDVKNKQYLKMDKLMSLPLCNFRYAEQYEKCGFLCIENDQDEIFNLTLEMFDFIKNKFEISSEQSLVNHKIFSYRHSNSNAYYSTSNFSVSFFNKLNKY